MVISIYTDGGARGNPGIAGYGFVLKNDTGDILYQGKKFLGVKTNNEAEYLGLIAALAYLTDHLSAYSPASLNIFSDSELLINQLRGRYKVKAPNLKPLFAAASDLIRHLSLPVSYRSIPRSQNCLADSLANQAMDSRL
ncbi:MAG: ribonuclease HI family protein [Candidatus Shapirobacteria bacterium]|jgi:ribonuclease HI